MRKTEIGLGITAGSLGIVLGLLSLFGVLRNADIIGTSSTVLLAANALGILGALIVKKHHVLGSVAMAVVTVAVLLFGFPWQSLSAVMYIMSVVMALVPVKAMQ